MALKSKTPAPKMACDQGASVSTHTRKNNRSGKFRQQIKQIIIRSCTWGFIPVCVAEWLIRRGGLAND
jgi:hypothetical protein